MNFSPFRAAKNKFRVYILTVFTPTLKERGCIVARAVLRITEKVRREIERELF